MTERIKELTPTQASQSETTSIRSAVENGDPKPTTEIEKRLGITVTEINTTDGEINLKSIEQVRDRSVFIDSSSVGDTVEIDGKLVVTDHGTFDKKLNVFSKN